MTTMKAAVVTQFGTEADVQEVERPTPGQHQALVKLISSGVCHTDLHAMEGDWPVKPTPPFIPGHEGVGIVEEVGPEAGDLAVGDRVDLQVTVRPGGPVSYTHLTLPTKA